MKLKTKFGKQIQRFFNNLKQIKIDRDNRKQFLIDIQQEIADPKSKFNEYRLAVNEDMNAITGVVSIPENFQLAGSDIMKYQKLQEVCMPITRYIATDINWGDYFEAPNFYYIEEFDDDNKPNDEILETVSCSYVVEWKYAPILDRFPNFKWELASFIGINSVILGGLIALLIVLL